MVTVKLIASKPLENKELKMETTVEDKFWSSIVSIAESQQERCKYANPLVYD